MATLTFMNVPIERYEQIVSYAREINSRVKLQCGRNEYFFVRFMRARYSEDEGERFEELAIEARAPVAECDREKANGILKDLKKFIIGEGDSSAGF